MTNFYRLIQGDCLRVLPSFNKNIAKIVIIDPPYSRFHNSKGEASLGDFVVLESFFKNLMPKVKRILRDDGCCFIFCDFRTYPSIFYGSYDSLIPANLIIWLKNFLGPGINFRPLHELILYLLCKNTHSPKDRHITDVWKADRVENRLHPFQKPTSLIKTMIENCSENNDLIIDPFMGSGTVMEVCQNLKRNCIGIEITSEFCETIKNRCFYRQFLDHEVTYSFEVFDG